MPRPSQNQIAEQVVQSILSNKLLPGERLGEQELSELFGVSRTLVREALMQLQARGFVEVRSRKGWYVVEPSLDEARDAFDARRTIESGMLRDAGRPLQSALRRMRDHVAQERRAIASGDAATRTFLLADFHVCLAECVGNRLLADVIRDLTARTSLVSLLYQSTHDARQSCEEHAGILEVLEAGETARAAQLMREHIVSVQDALGDAADASTRQRERLRTSLAPLKLVRR
jgi:DNA-binding GntR family transcriptional regulator